VSDSIQKPLETLPMQVEEDEVDAGRFTHRPESSRGPSSADDASAEVVEVNTGTRADASPLAIDGESKRAAPTVPAETTGSMSMLHRGRLSNGSSARGSCRTVEETVVDEKGYIITRRVTKYFDNDGNEIPEKPDVAEPNGDELEEHIVPAAAEEAVQSPQLPLPNSNDEPVSSTSKRVKGAQSTDISAPSALKRKPKLDSNGRPRSSGLGAKKASKHPKGNIASYFGKK
jgi:hypothetical protein